MEQIDSDRTISSQIKYQGKIVNIREDTILLENGAQAQREVVEHRPAVAILPIDSENNALLVKQYRHPTSQYILEVPAGLVELDEEPDETAMRELREETGYASKNLRLLGGLWSSPGFTDEYLYCYLAKDLVENRLPADEDEEITVEKIPLSRVDQLIKLGEIQDAKTVAVILMATKLF